MASEERRCSETKLTLLIHDRGLKCLNQKHIILLRPIMIQVCENLRALTFVTAWIPNTLTIMITIEVVKHSANIS